MTDQKQPEIDLLRTKLRGLKFHYNEWRMWQANLDRLLRYKRMTGGMKYDVTRSYTKVNEHRTAFEALLKEIT